MIFFTQTCRPEALPPPNDRLFLGKSLSISRPAAFWIVAAALLASFDWLSGDVTLLRAKTALVFWESLVPLAVCIGLVGLMRLPLVRENAAVPYILFFSISITSILGMTKTLTGSHSESSNIYLYGLSFYTASLAFLSKKKQVPRSSPLMIGNPLLLITGPILTKFAFINHQGFKRRFLYFFPFVVLGFFLYQIVATPLTKTFPLIERTDVVSSIVFAGVFELFVYSNFCGLSLVIYGVCGILGLKIPLNFRQPFSSSNIIEFWKGWHVSLSTVLKELFYAPARARVGTSLAVIFVFLSSALWHGVTVNFLLWGLFHGLCFVASITLLKKKSFRLSFVLMVAAIVLGRMIFADSNTDRLIEKIQFTYTDWGALAFMASMPKVTKLALICAILFVSAEIFLKKTKYFVKKNYKFYRLPLICLFLLFVSLFLFSTGVGVDYAVYGQR